MTSATHWTLRAALLTALFLPAAACPGSKPAPVKEEPAGPPPPPKTGYTPGPVAASGAIKGKVTLTGTAPTLPQVRCARDLDVCGKGRPNQTLLVGADGALKNVIVSLTDIHAGKALPTHQAKLDIKQCAYTPRVQAVAVGTSLILGNADPIPHDVGGSRGDRVLFSRTVLRSQEKVELTSPGMMTVGCDMHSGVGAAATCETGVIGVMANPYFAVTGDDGSFSLSEVPAGSYTLQAWHETLGDQIQKVTVAPNGSVTADFHFAAKAK
jgi:plastocyanin